MHLFWCSEHCFKLRPRFLKKMEDFVIQCAICGTNFDKEKEYENHDCSGLGASEVKMEPQEPEEEEQQTEGQEPEETPQQVNKQVKQLEARMRKIVEQKMKKRSRGRPASKRRGWNGQSVNSIKPNVVKVEPKEMPSEEEAVSLPVNIKPEPLDLCEVVNVKEEPQDEMDMEEDNSAVDPLSTPMEDILGLQDEDYLIENFVEYDHEISGNLEIDENPAEEEQIEIASLIENVNAAAAAMITPKKNVSPNVGKRILQTDYKGYSCPECDKKYFEKSKLEEHLKVSHKNPRPYSCTICKKKFTHKNYVNLHMRVHTGEKPYKCTMCERSYSHKTSFTIHMRIHNGERPYECNVCGKKCYDKSGLTSHMRSHTKETPYQCECCGRRFTHSKSLLVHRRNHTGEKPYVCPHCGRAFRHWHKHKIHIRLHTGERPYKCKVCNKGFPRNDEVKRHMKSHIGIKSFKCSICGVYCATQASITGHINLHHVNLVTDKKFLPDKTIVKDSQSGILGKKIQFQPSPYRMQDISSYDQYPDRPPQAQIEEDEPQTIVTARPMTSQEKVTNKSVTYRQFLNDQERQLLAKGLKVVNKNDNTYGLAPVSPPSADSKSSNAESLKKLELENVFIKVNNVRRNSSAANSSKPTRIILPNVTNTKKSVVLGETPSKLLLQSVDQKPTTSMASSNSGSSQQQILIQTVGNSAAGISPPMTIQQTSSSNSTTDTSKKGGSILQAALTANKPATMPKDNIIVLNKGISGGGSSAPPLVMLSQPQLPTQQLLLLPGINGGPARLVILQHQQPIVKLEPPAQPAESASTHDNPSAEDNVVIKQEPNSHPPPMVQLHTVPTQNKISNSKSNGQTQSDALVRIKEEPKDPEEDESGIFDQSDQSEVEKERNGNAPLLQTAIIKTEPTD